MAKCYIYHLWYAICGVSLEQVHLQAKPFLPRLIAVVARLGAISWGKRPRGRLVHGIAQELLPFAKIGNTTGVAIKSHLARIMFLDPEQYS